MSSLGTQFANELKDFLANEGVVVADNSGKRLPVNESFLKYMSGYLFSSAKRLIKEELDKEDRSP